MDAHARQLALYPIGTIAALCGVDAATLRNWESRYHLLHPVRDHKGHRFYTEADLERIRLIVALLDSGLLIDDVVAALDAGRAQRPDQPHSSQGWKALRRKFTDAIADLDERALAAAYNEALATYPVRCVLQRVLVPLLRECGKRWHSSPGAVAEEHFFTFFLRNNLGARFHHRGLNNYGPKLLAACMPGERHELGLLLFALSANERGYRVTVLGSDMPLPETVHAARRVTAHAVVLAAPMDPDPPVLDQLPAFMHNVAKPVFVRGSDSKSVCDRYAALGMHVLESDDIDQSLEQIRAVLSRRL